MLANSKVVYIFFYVKDLAVSRDFFDKKLGLRVLEEDEACVKFDAGDVILALNRAGDFGIPLSDGPDDTSITIFHTYGVDALRASLEARGVEFSGPTQRLDIGSAAAFYDPDGHCFSLYQPSDMAMMWPSAKKIRAILHAGAQSPSLLGKVRPADEEKLNPEALASSKIIYQFLFIGNTEKASEFYAQTLHLPVLEAAPHAGVVKYDAGGFILATHLIDSEEGVRAKREDLARPRSVAVVFHVEDARAVHQQLASAANVRSSDLVKAEIGLTARFQDPDGHTFYIYEPSEGAMRWPSGKKISEILSQQLTISA
jgi:predicted enzyme related to lactoylglutathione lyase